MNENIDQEVEKEYQLLTASEKNINSRKLNTMLLIFFISFLIALSSVIFAYHNYNQLKNKNQQNNISIKYENEIALNIDNLKPNLAKTVQTIVIENNSHKQLLYKLEFIKVSNKLAYQNNISYTLFRNNQPILQNQKLPLNDKVILKAEIANSQSIVTYKLVINNNLTAEQSAQNQGSFQGTLWLKVNNSN